MNSTDAENQILVNEIELAHLNDSYHKLIFELRRKNRCKKYKECLLKLNFKQLLEEFRYRNYARNNFSISSNIINVKSRKSIKLDTSRIAVYSCITGNYDKILEPVTYDKNIDYYMFTDLDIPTDSKWEKINICEFAEYQNYSPALLNRRIKMIPFEYLKSYDYSVYIDGNIQIVGGIRNLIENMGGASLGIFYHPTRDCIYDEAVAVLHHKKAAPELIDNQLEYYKQEGFPAHNGLTENSIIIRKHSDILTIKLMNMWWNEYLKYPTRDQISLPFVMWKSQYPKECFFPLGSNLENSPCFNRIQKHLMVI